MNSDKGISKNFIVQSNSKITIDYHKNTATLEGTLNNGRKIKLIAQYNKDDLADHSENTILQHVASVFNSSLEKINNEGIHKFRPPPNVTIESEDLFKDLKAGASPALQIQTLTSQNEGLALEALEKIEKVSQNSQQFQQKASMSQGISTSTPAAAASSTSNMSEAMQSYDVKLSPNPLMPVRSNKIDPIRMEEFISLHPPECQNAVRALCTNLRHVSKEEFMEKVQATVQSLNLMLQQKGNPDYLIVAINGKSNGWITQLALPFLNKLPHNIITTNFSSYLERELTKKALDEAYFLPKVIVFLDDGIYSGEQMTKCLNVFMRDLSHYSQNPDNDVPLPEFIIAPVFATEFGIRHVQEANTVRSTLGVLQIPEESMSHVPSEDMQRWRTIERDFASKIFVTRYEPIQTINQVVRDPHLLQMLTAMYWASDTGESGHECGPKSRGNVYFDHKVPDMLSFVEALEKGLIFDQNGQVVLRKSPPNNKELSYTIIPRTVTPYHPSFESFVRQVEEQNRMVGQ